MVSLRKFIILFLNSLRVYYCTRSAILGSSKTRIQFPIMQDKSSLTGVLGHTGILQMNMDVRRLSSQSLGSQAVSGPVASCIPFIAICHTNSTIFYVRYGLKNVGSTAIKKSSWSFHFRIWHFGLFNPSLQTMRFILWLMH